MVFKSKKKYVKLTGKVAWARLYSPDEYKGKKFYKMNFYPDDESSVVFNSQGLSNKWKTDDGSVSGVQGEFVTLKRYTEIKGPKGTIFNAPPGIYDKDGSPLITYEYDKKGRAVMDEDGDPIQIGDNEMILIGNGSVVEVKLEIYSTSKGNGAKLESLRIIDLIEYVPPEDDEEEEEEEKPAQKKSTGKKKELDW